MKKDRGALITIYISLVIAGIGLGIVIPIIPLVLKDTGVNEAMVGLATTIMGLTAAIFSMPAGKLIDRVGAKKVMALGLAIYAISMAAFPLAKTVAIFYAIRGLEGVGAAGILVGTETAVNLMSTPETRARNIGLYATFMGVGLGMGPVIGGFLSQFGVNTPFFATSTVSLLAGVFVLTSVKAVSGSYEFSTAISDKKLLTLIWLSLAAAGVYGLYESSVLSMTPLYIKQVGYNISVNGIILSILVAGAVITPPLTGLIADKVGKRKILYISGIIMASSCILFPLSSNLVQMGTISFLMGCGAGGLYTTALSMIGDKVHPSKMGSANAMFSTIYGIGSIFGPVGAGYAFYYLGRSAPYYIISVLVFAALSLALIQNMRLPSELMQTEEA